jgi:hypothetical protein
MKTLIYDLVVRMEPCHESGKISVWEEKKLDAASMTQTGSLDLSITASLQSFLSKENS